MELENPHLSPDQIEQKLVEDFDALDVKVQLREVSRAKSVVGPDVKAAELQHDRTNKNKPKRKNQRRIRNQSDIKLNGRVKRNLIALFTEFKVPQRVSELAQKHTLEAQAQQQLQQQQIHQQLPLHQQLPPDPPHTFSGHTFNLPPHRRRIEQRKLSNMRRRDGELAEMRNLLKASSASKSNPRLRLLNSVYEKLSDAGRKTMLGLYVTSLRDVFAREEYRMFVDAFKLVVKEMYPSLADNGKRSMHELWKYLKGPKLDFLKGKLELIFPKVLGRTLRKPVPSEAPVLTEGLMFSEALRILEPSDAKIAEVALKDQEALMAEEEQAQLAQKAVLEAEEARLEEQRRLQAEAEKPKERVKVKKKKKKHQQQQQQQLQQQQQQQQLQQQPRSCVPGRKKLLEMLEETMEAEEDGDLAPELDDDEDEGDKEGKVQCEPRLEADPHRELAPLPQSESEFPQPLSSSSRSDLIPWGDLWKQTIGMQKSLTHANETGSLTHISGITDISAPFHINASDLSMGEFYRNASTNSSVKEVGPSSSVPHLGAPVANHTPLPPVSGVVSSPPQQLPDASTAVEMPSMTTDSQPPVIFNVALTDQGLFVPIENSAASTQVQQNFFLTTFLLLSFREGGNNVVVIVGFSCFY